MMTPLSYSGLFLALALSSRVLAAGTFDFLTINVAGLPSVLNNNDVPGDKSTNAGTIGTILAEKDYDIVHMQEDFNYHAYIYATDNHTYRTATSGGVPFGSGLNTVSNYDWTEFTRTTWSKCYLNDGDCLTPKGFTFMRLTIDDIQVDLYNLHSDAGSEDGDVSARASDIAQVLAAVEANSVGKAVIIGGDTNDRWTNSGRSINTLTDAGFTDAWVQLINGGTYPTAGSTANACSNPAANNQCEVVDKVFYRDGTTVSLNATLFNYESSVFVQSDGDILTDHNPIRVVFSYESS